VSIFDRLMGGVSKPQPVVHAGQGSGVPPTRQDIRPNLPGDQQPNISADPRGGTPPNGGSVPNVQQDPISPLDQFKDIWKTTGTDGKTPVDPFSQPLLQADPKKFAEAASKMNFAQGIDPALLQKATSGDVEALMQVINTASQQAFLAAGTLSTQMVEGATQTNNKRLNSSMEEKFKEFMLKQQRSDNPVLQHPSAAPMLDLAKQQLMRQHPDKSAEQIQQLAENYLVTWAGELKGQETASKNKGAVVVDNQDFSEWG
jgi:hypothetical protein